MPRFYFDIRDGDELYPDEEGIELANLHAAEVEAAQSLVDLTKQRTSGSGQRGASVEVRTAEGTLFRAGLTFDRARAKTAHN